MRAGDSGTAIRGRSRVRYAGKITATEFAAVPPPGGRTDDRHRGPTDRPGSA